jgi:hypothetical protein
MLPSILLLTPFSCPWETLGGVVLGPEIAYPSLMSAETNLSEVIPQVKDYAFSFLPTASTVGVIRQISSRHVRYRWGRWYNIRKTFSLRDFRGKTVPGGVFLPRNRNEMGGKKKAYLEGGIR